MLPGACWTSVPNFMEIVQAVKKLNSISRERLNFRRRPILCTILYRNPMQASNFGGTFDQRFFRIFLENVHRSCLSTSSIPWCKKVKNDQKLKSRGGGGTWGQAREDVWTLYPLFTSAHRLTFQGLLYNAADNRSGVAILLKNWLQRLHLTIEILRRADLPCSLHKWANKGNLLASGTITVPPRVQTGEYILFLPDSCVQKRQLSIILTLHRKMQRRM